MRDKGVVQRCEGTEGAQNRGSRAWRRSCAERLARLVREFTRGGRRGTTGSRTCLGVALIDPQASRASASTLSPQALWDGRQFHVSARGGPVVPKFKALVQTLGRTSAVRTFIFMYKASIFFDKINKSPGG